MIIKKNDSGWEKWDERQEFFQGFVEKYWDCPDPKIRLAARFKETGKLSRKFMWKAWLEMNQQKNIKAATIITSPEKKKRRERVLETCVLCPSDKGPFLYTDQGKLIHRLCADLMPETKIIKDGQEEYVTGVEDVHEERWAFLCSGCRKKGSKFGACIQCKKCASSMHVTCANKADFLLEEDGVLKFYCSKHNIARKKEKTKKKEKELMDLGKTFIKGTLVTCHWYFSCIII